MYQPAMPDTASHASTRRQARTDGGGGEKESSVPELCSLESVCGQACVYRHIARCVFTTIFMLHAKAEKTTANQRGEGDSQPRRRTKKENKY